MYSRIFLFLFLFSLNFVDAQTVKWSSAIQTNRKAEYMQILGTTDNGDFYVLRSNLSLEDDREKAGLRSRFYLLSYYSAGLNVVWEKELKASYPDGHVTDVTMFNGRVVVTGYTLNKKSKVYTFYAQFITPEGKWDGQPVLLDSMVSEMIDKDNKPRFIMSQDQSVVAFSYRMIDYNGQSQTFQVVAFDTLLNVRYRKEIQVNISPSLFNPFNAVITNRGSFFILGIHYTTEKRVREPDQSFFELYGYNAPLDRTVNTQIRSSEKFLTDVGISVDNMNNSIVAAGFFSDKSQYSVAGVFYYSLTEDSLTENRSVLTPFGPEYLQKFMAGKKENRELVNFSIDRLFVRRDGGVGIIAESIYQTTRSYYDYYMQTFVSHYYYHFGNIMVLSVNPDGNILWNNVITKDQNSVDDNGYYSSYFCAVTGGRLAAVYNKYVEGTSSVLITFVDPAGSQKTDVLFREEEKVTVIPRSARQVDDETLLMPAYKQNKFYIVQLTF